MRKRYTQRKSHEKIGKYFIYGKICRHPLIVSTNSPLMANLNEEEDLTIYIIKEILYLAKITKALTLVHRLLLSSLYIVVLEYRSQVTGHRSQVTGRRSQVISK